MSIQFKLAPVNMEIIQQTINERILRKIPNDYWKLFEQGNFIVYKEWKFYPIRDKAKFKKTATDILTMNERNRSNFTVIAENISEAEGFLGFSNNKNDDALYIWSEWPEIRPTKIFNNINELIAKLNASNHTYDNSDFEDTLHLIKDKKMFFYIMDEEVGDVMGDVSFDCFPAFSYYFWTDQNIPKSLAEKQSHLSLEMINKDTFINDVLVDIDMEENSIILNPLSNEASEFYPHEVLEAFE